MKSGIYILTVPFSKAKDHGSFIRVYNIETFKHGDDGTVLHMTSHYYLQRAELRTKRHKMSASDYIQTEKRWSLIKLHGSVNWWRYIENKFDLMFAV